MRHSRIVRKVSHDKLSEGLESHPTSRCKVSKWAVTDFGTRSPSQRVTYSANVPNLGSRKASPVIDDCREGPCVWVIATRVWQIRLAHRRIVRRRSHVSRAADLPVSDARCWPSNLHLNARRKLMLRGKCERLRGAVPKLKRSPVPGNGEWEAVQHQLSDCERQRYFEAI